MLRVDQIPGKGRGLRADRAIPADTEMERAPAIRLPAGQRALLDQTGIFPYYFADPAAYGGEDAGKEGADCLFAFGRLTFCNHAAEPNAAVTWIEDSLGFWAVLTAIRDIAANEEITLFYTNIADYKSGDLFI